MSSKMNCWEIMDCGRHPGGKNEEKDGACPAATSRDLDGINKGTCGGRACWKVKVDRNGMVIPHWSHPDKNCLGCMVLDIVRDEEESFTL